jgi:hypothetical protein
MTQDPQVPFVPSSQAGADEVAGYARLNALRRASPVPQDEVLGNLGLYQVRASFVRMQFMYNLYQRALHTHGVIMEFGVRWGQNLALFSTFRAIHEPYNLSRRIIGFDTFEGFPSVAPEDGATEEVRPGAYSVSAGYETHLDAVLDAHAQLAPRSHVKRHELVKGDVVETLPRYLEQHPETIIALAYFDLDLYAPTKACLEAIRPHLARNSVVGFDELCYDRFPGETQALKEAWGLADYEVVRDPASPQQSYLVFR